MRWHLPGLAGIGESGGFFGGELARAVAVAWAASEGDDALVTQPYYASDTLLVGLWQVPVLRGDEDARWRLCDPVRAAQDAYDRVRAAGDSWDWSPYYNSRAYNDVFADAVAVVRSGRRADLPQSYYPGY